VILLEFTMFVWPCCGSIVEYTTQTYGVYVLFLLLLYYEVNETVIIPSLYI